MAIGGGIRAIAIKASGWQRAACAFWRCERCFSFHLGVEMVFSYIVSSALRRNIIGG